MPASIKKLPGERNFGLFFALVFLVLAAHLYWIAEIPLAAAAIAFLGFAFLVAAFLKPALLKPLNKAWYWFGIAIGRVINPFVLGAIFFLLLTPIAVLMRAFGRDALCLRTRPERTVTYWVTRDVPGPDPDSFKNQF